MKIVESQSAVLSNFEVYQHLTEQRDRYKKNKRRGPPNLETVVRELLQYMRTYPGPLSQQPLPYTPDCIAQLLERLRPYNLAKGEVVMLLNLRPASVAALNTVVEDMPERFDEEQQEAIVKAIADVLGQFPENAEAQDENGEAAGDVDMDNTTAA
ncbi:calcitonin gene-peptide-receptor component protein [Dactylonectria macrodidyma]|uniref:DNA-directed RNA polymerase III subunit RPC9 n=1 Tax=Dactylonectria macrodidyma TaxID=307937 RepID=A0A9P9EXH6_9HYPO|nr:calcitonin gene-peptide-receptor component protein [Dactylonectria macrodidyma]